MNLTVERGAKTILHDVSLKIIKNEKVMIFGSSGSGKSSVLFSLAGAYQPRRGLLYFQGKEISRSNLHELRQAVSYIPQEPMLGEGLVRDAVLTPFEYKANEHKKPSDEKIISVFSQLNLSPDLLTQNTESISGGEKQRVAVARGLLLEKRIFLADEITSALDEDSKKNLINLFQNMDVTLITVSHDREWFDISDRFIKMENGGIAENCVEKKECFHERDN